MRPRPRLLLALTGVGTLAGCAGAPSKPAAPAATTAAATPANQPANCGLKLLGHQVRPGEDLQAVFAVKQNAQWCFDGMGLSGASTEGQTIVQAPSHGQLRLVHQPGAVVFGYRPAPGFIGTDQFRIGVPAQIETFYLSAHATVAP